MFEEVAKGLLTLVGALLIFTLGLLAWRKQLLDKRKFEVAEEVVVMSARLAAQVRILRQPNDHQGMGEWIKAKMDHPTADTADYEQHMARRAWLYRIPEKKQEAFNKVHEDFTVTYALARMYLDDEIAKGLERIESIYERVVLAAEVLIGIDPNPSIDPENQSEDGETITPDWPYDPDDKPDNEDAVAKEQLYFPMRFRVLGGPDALGTELDATEDDLAVECRPYTDEGPYNFLCGFLVTLIPPPAKTWWQQRRSP
jgi:hypothetical protein